MLLIDIPLIILRLHGMLLVVVIVIIRLLDALIFISVEDSSWFPRIIAARLLLKSNRVAITLIVHISIRHRVSFLGSLLAALILVSSSIQFSTY